MRAYLFDDPSERERAWTLIEQQEVLTLLPSFHRRVRDHPITTTMAAAWALVCNIDCLSAGVGYAGVCSVSPSLR